MKSQRLLSNAEIASFCSQTAMILNAGITPYEGMSILMQDTKDEKGKALVNTIIESLGQGETFYKALGATDVFPDYVLHMVELGEQSGNLDNVMQSLAAYYEHEDMIADSIRSAVRYPLIMIGMMLLVIYVLLTKVLPIFNQVFEQLGSEMSGVSASLLNLGNTLNRYGIVILAVIVVVFIVYFLGFKTRKGKAFTTNFLNEFALTKGFYEKVAAGRFASGLAMTIASGLDTYSSLDLVSVIVEHKKTKEKIAVCKSCIEEGLNLSEALEKADIFSSLYSRMVAVGFRTGSIDQVMGKIAEDYEKDTEKKLSEIIATLEPTLVIILSVIVGLILLSVILPLMGIMTSIG
ncbi:MAG: type II secretion system F family protein [Lachnospiraceae bacterium]|nr:type II secretion system F family protein [Lachnospiraceae bacterium]